jgi:hypothetical protein
VLSEVIDFLKETISIQTMLSTSTKKRKTCSHFKEIIHLMPLQNCHIPYLPMQARNQALLRIEHDGDAPAPPLKAAMGKKEGPGQTSMNHSVAGVPPRRRLHHEEEEDGSAPTWPRFVQLVNTHFGPPLIDSLLNELATLRHTGTVDKFCSRFMALSCHDHSLTETQQIQLFTTGLGEPLHTDVAL